MTGDLATGAGAPGGPGPGGARRPVRIANFSGFYGDWLPAARQMAEGGPVDVLTGDYLAELTMIILWKAKARDPAAGYARTFLAQLEQVLGTCLDRGIKIVTNAGGLNPAGLAERIGELAVRLGLAPRVAYVAGDDLLPRLDELIASGVSFAHLDTGQPLAGSGAEPVTANAYLGGWAITEALGSGADVVVCPRVTDAALTSGPAAWWHDWARDDWDALAGAVVAGHVIECGPQACGGNYPFLGEIADRRYPGFPVAEVAADGTAVITKHPGTGGLVSVGTVTAQMLYEIAEPDYPGPDVTARFGTARLTQQGPDRVLISGVRGMPPPGRLKVAVNYLGGYRNTMTLVLTGLDIEEKAAWARQELFSLLGGEESFGAVDVRLLRYDIPDAPSNEQATAHLRITVFDSDERKAGRAFSDAVMALALGGYAGFHTTTPPTPASAYGVYWPALVPASEVEQVVVLPGGERRVVPHTASLLAALAEPGHDPVAGAEAPAAGTGECAAVDGADAGGASAGPPGAGTGGDAAATGAGTAAVAALAPAQAATGQPGAGKARCGGDGGEGPAAPVRRVPLGWLAGARSGDKGGNANVGLWARKPEAYPWLRAELTVERFRELLPEAAGLVVRRYELPNLLALNFVVTGLLGQGVAATARPDPQAKGLGEYLRSRTVEVPAALLEALGIGGTAGVPGRHAPGGGGAAAGPPPGTAAGPQAGHAPSGGGRR
jgi:hypothetical protein